jgi:hypothetical protein
MSNASLDALAAIISQADPTTALLLREWRRSFVVELNGRSALTEYLLAQKPRVLQWHLDDLLRRTALEAKQFIAVTTDLDGKEPFCQVVSSARLFILRHEGGA